MPSVCSIYTTCEEFRLGFTLDDLEGKHRLIHLTVCGLCVRGRQLCWQPGCLGLNTDACDSASVPPLFSLAKLGTSRNPLHSWWRPNSNSCSESVFPIQAQKMSFGPPLFQKKPGKGRWSFLHFAVVFFLPMSLLSVKVTVVWTLSQHPRSLAEGQSCVWMKWNGSTASVLAS